MSSRYDSKTTIFNPDGKLLQVEYAINNINNAGIAIAIITKDGIIMACEKATSLKLLEKNKQSEKIYKIDNNIACVAGGLASDANLLIDWAREFSQNFYSKYKSITPVENLVRFLADEQQIKTQRGSNRPFGAGFLFGGYDKIHGYQIYNTLPSGVYNCWRAHAIGQNSKNAESVLKESFEENMSLDDGMTLAVKVIRKCLDKNRMTSDNSKFIFLLYY